MENLECTELLSVAQLFVNKSVQTLRERVRHAHRVRRDSDLHNTVVKFGQHLNLDRLPEVYILKETGFNAFTFGADQDPKIILFSEVLDRLSRTEVSVVIAHEMGHVKSRHMIYHTLAEALLRGSDLLGTLAGVNFLLSVPIRLMLLSWYRKSELSADRAALIATQNLEAVKVSIAKLALGGRSVSNGQLTTLMSQESSLVKVTELFEDHPTHRNRILEIQNFARSPEYTRIIRKLERALLLTSRKPLRLRCSFCDAVKNLDDLVCPKCGKCQV